MIREHSELTAMLTCASCNRTQLHLLFWNSRCTKTN